MSRTWLISILCLRPCSKHCTTGVAVDVIKLEEKSNENRALVRSRTIANTGLNVCILFENIFVGLPVLRLNM